MVLTLISQPLISYHVPHHQNLPPAGSSKNFRSSGACAMSQLPPPSPPPSTNQSDQSKSVHSSDDEDIKNAHIPKVNLNQDWWKPLSKEEQPATPEHALGSTELHKKDLEALAFEIVKVFHLNVIHLQYQMEECHKPLIDKVDDAIIRYVVRMEDPASVYLEDESAIIPDVGV
ncbi:hypothetical protein Tco_0871419 [Tanacetum coccineum]